MALVRRVAHLSDFCQSPPSEGAPSLRFLKRWAARTRESGIKIETWEHRPPFRVNLKDAKVPKTYEAGSIIPVLAESARTPLV